MAISCWFVYQLIDTDGQVFYVGMTSNFSQRMSNHYCAPYGDRIATVASERFNQESDAAERELGLIQTLRPELNRAGIPVVASEPGRVVCRCGTQLSYPQRICVDCVASALDAFLHHDRSMADLGREYGVTRERLRQLFDDSCGMPATRLRRAYRIDRAAMNAEKVAQQELVRAARDGVTCVTCGRLHARRRQGGWAKSCSRDCSSMWGEVRYFVDEYHAAHQQRIASWVLRNEETSKDIHIRSCARVLRGDAPEYDGAWMNRDRRYLHPGSKRFRIAVRAYREEWPAFETWPEPIRRQVIEHVSSIDNAQAAA